MIKRTLGQLEKMVDGKLLQGDEEMAQLTIHGVSIDSRTLQLGMLFVPIVGEHFDGHAFVRDAVHKGATAVLWQQDRGEPPEGVPIIRVKDTLIALQRLAANYRKQLTARIVGVTGSNGKTTTKDMIASILSTAYNVTKTQGNYNNHLGLPLTLLQMSESTEVAVLEMGMSDLGEIELLSRIALPDVAVITNIGEAHLLQLGSREAIAKAKLEIIEGLKQEGLLVLPGDEPLLARKAQGIRTIRFGTANDNDFYPLSITMTTEGVEFAVNAYSKLRFNIPLIGRHHVYNALAAMAVGMHFELTAEQIRQGLTTLQSSGMRGELLHMANGLTVLNDAYNASPSSMKAALANLAELAGYNMKIAVLGDMLELGPQEEKFHQELGRMLDPELIHYVFTYGKRASLIAEAAAPRYQPGRVRSFADHHEISAAIQEVAKPAALLLIKGSRGMKLEKVLSAL